MTKRIAVVDKKKCRPDKCQHECRNFCPPVRAGLDETVVIKEKSVISETLCIGCGICPKKCPFGAITIINLASEPDNMMHQYGQNSFRLYGLPAPQKGQIVGLLGPNGIGKSTTLKILSNQLQPNLGNFEHPPEWQAVLEKFRGTELQKYLIALKEGKTKTVYKPQQVDLIPTIAKGTARELIKDERKVLGSIAKQLDIENILDRQLDQLSGGELQRVAIAAVMCKDADVYYFDEPSSFLDVFHRIQMAKAVRTLADAGKSVVVVEHDLATLDLLTDLIHIVYGHPSAYGVISDLYPSRRGVNMFLDGFIKEENIRFRDEELSFKSVGQVFRGKQKALTYPALKHSYGNFSLDIDEGHLYRGEILGVFGRNALGKTTFAKLLAGELKPTEGYLDTSVKISYKPQYIKADTDATVAQLLMLATKDFGSTHHKIEILQPLDLEHLLDQSVSHLSGGELQRVAIAVCLSREADVYLLDEPSAYLDVEQRVRLSKMLRKFIENNGKTCMVIDHDMLMLNYVSDRALIFTGKAAIHGHALAPVEINEGMNTFLKELGITLRADPDSGRPRPNKPDSQKDKEQKAKGDYYGG